MTIATNVRRVLIVDDVEDLRALLRLALSFHEMFDVVAEAADGLEAVAQAELHHPDLVILDLSMPVLDGLEALPLILRAAPDARVVVVSGFAESRMREPALAAGAVAYLEKGDIFGVVDALQLIDLG
jgi:DNA-binding NarL/FixJ family response regulator